MGFRWYKIKDEDGKYGYIEMTDNEVEAFCRSVNPKVSITEEQPPADRRKIILPVHFMEGMMKEYFG